MNKVLTITLDIGQAVETCASPHDGRVNATEVVADDLRRFADMLEGLEPHGNPLAVIPTYDLTSGGFSLSRGVVSLRT